MIIFELKSTPTPSKREGERDEFLALRVPETERELRCAGDLDWGGNESADRVAAACCSARMLADENVSCTVGRWL